MGRFALLPVQNIINVVTDITNRVSILQQQLPHFIQTRAQKRNRCGSNEIIIDSSDEVYFVFCRCEGVPYCVQASKRLLPVNRC